MKDNLFTSFNVCYAAHFENRVSARRSASVSITLADIPTSSGRALHGTLASCTCGVQVPLVLYPFADLALGLFEALHFEWLYI